MDPLIKGAPFAVQPRHSQKKQIFSYTAVMILSVAFVTAARWSLNPWLGFKAPWIFYFLAILISASAGGTLFGVIATVISLCLGIFFFIEPLHTFGMPILEDKVSVVLFLMVGVVISAITGRLKKAIRKNQDYLSTLQNNEQMMTMALKSAHMVAWNWTFGAPHIDHSVNSEIVLGLSYTSFSGFLERVHPDDEPWVRKRSQETIRNGTEHVLEYRIIRPDTKRMIWVEDRAKCLRDSNGNVTRVTGVFTDITERKNAEAELRRTADELKAAKEMAEAASKAKTQFLANMSHEIRTPLGVILGYAELLQDSELSSEDRNQYLSVILRNGEILSKVINEILDLSRIEFEKMNFESTPFDLRDLVSEIRALLGLRAQEKALNFKIHVADEVPKEMISDSLRLKQILINLLGNAIKFTDEGSVDLFVQNSKSNREMIDFLVCDTGPGIQPEYISNLFSPFSQMDATMTRKHGGSGLGLAISKRFAKALGGDLQLQTAIKAPQRGTAFLLTLPSHMPTQS